MDHRILENALTHCSHTWCGVWDCPVQGWELDSMIFVGPFQLTVFLVLWFLSLKLDLLLKYSKGGSVPGFLSCAYCGMDIPQCVV